ncbi:hypothetical protein ACTI_41010 [Actinoplanes sp. OR16]|uniref:hypothetical protein n=1 Tax=Actinoplanes sp. OR16 TaxID=946334 RepID=UPI000F71AC77|nr:hypothetical protein [Actinoplanes sp. OR16]BBH67416.1 hypothetical protein ACTI_41010 [Actinoplanes sp. OR16]
MPVSRKRKKPTRSKTTARAERRRDQSRRESARIVLEAWEAANSRRVEQARPAARELVVSLGGGAGEDEVCRGLGELIERFGGPDEVAEALIAEAAAAAVRPLLLTLAAILPADQRARIDAEIEDPELIGRPLWTRDRSGARFAILARFAGPARYYLWDVDTAGAHPVTVHSGYYASPEEALAAWQVAASAGGTGWHEATDATRLHDLLPVPDGVITPGEPGEYHRSRRLAEILSSPAAS